MFNVHYRRHVSGYLDPVKPAWVNEHKDTFKDNERVSLFGEWTHGFFAMTYVGATNVGSIALHFDKNLVTNEVIPVQRYYKDKDFVANKESHGVSFTVPEISHTIKPSRKVESGLTSSANNTPSTEDSSSEPEVPSHMSNTGIRMKKGEEMGMFNFGSTIVLCVEVPKDYEWKLQDDQKVQLGQLILGPQ